MQTVFCGSTQCPCALLDMALPLPVPVRRVPVDSGPQAATPPIQRPQTARLAQLARQPPLPLARPPVSTAQVRNLVDICRCVCMYVCVHACMRMFGPMEMEMACRMDYAHTYQHMQCPAAAFWRSARRGTHCCTRAWERPHLLRPGLLPFHCMHGSLHPHLLHLPPCLHHCSADCCCAAAHGCSACMSRRHCAGQHHRRRHGNKLHDMSPGVLVAWRHGCQPCHCRLHGMPCRQDHSRWWSGGNLLSQLHR